MPVSVFMPVLAVCAITCLCVFVCLPAQHQHNSFLVISPGQSLDGSPFYLALNICLPGAMSLNGPVYDVVGPLLLLSDWNWPFCLCHLAKFRDWPTSFYLNKFCFI